LGRGWESWDFVNCAHRLYIASHFSLLIVHHLSLLCFTHFHMSEEQQQSLREYSFQVATLPNTVPPVPQNQATVLQDSAVSSTYQVSLVSSTHSRWLFQIHPAQEISQNAIFLPPPVAHPAYFEPPRAGYPQYYGPIPPVSLFT
jgi:hypothetical protein